MSAPHDALLQACLLSSKLKLIENSRQGALATRLLDLAVICSRLACEHAEASTLTAAQQVQQLQTNARDVFTLYTHVTGAFQNALMPYKSRALPSWDAPADPAKPSLPPAHLSSAAMGELVATLVPLLHIPVEKSLLSTIVLSLQDPLAEALRSTMMDQMEEDLLERLTGPLFEHLLPTIREKISERLVQESPPCRPVVVHADASHNIPHTTPDESAPRSAQPTPCLQSPYLDGERNRPAHHLVRRIPRVPAQLSPYPAPSTSPPPAGICADAPGHPHREVPQPLESQVSYASPSPPLHTHGSATPPPSQRPGASDYKAYTEPVQAKSRPEFTSTLRQAQEESLVPLVKRRRVLDDMGRE